MEMPPFFFWRARRDGRRISHIDWPSQMLAESISTCAEETTWQALQLGQDEFERGVLEGNEWYGMCPLCADRLAELVRRAEGVGSALSL